jgi:hypothetical protein
VTSPDAVQGVSSTGRMVRSTTPVIRTFTTQQTLYGPELGIGITF